MRWIKIVVVASFALVASAPGAEAKEGNAPTPGDIAEWARSDQDADVQAAAKAASTLSPAQLRQVFDEIRDQSLVAQLLAKKIRSLTWEETPFDTALRYLTSITGVSFYVTPKARAEKRANIKLNLAIDGLPISDLVDLITQPHDLRWRVRGGIVRIGTAEEFSPAPEAAPSATLLQKVQSTTINLSVDEQSFSDVVKTLQIQTGLNILVDPRASGNFKDSVVTKLVLTDVALPTCLTMLVSQGAEEGAWTTRDNVILISTQRLLNADGGLEAPRKPVPSATDKALAKRIQNLRWESASLETAVAYLQTITGLNYYITPKVRQEKIEDISITMAVNDIGVSDLLDLLTHPYELRWKLQGKLITIGTSDEFQEAAKDDPAAALLRAKVDATTVNLVVDEQQLPEVVKTLQIQTGFNIVIDPRISAEADRARVSLRLSDVALSTALNALASAVDKRNGTWRIRGQVIWITSKEFQQDK